MIKKIRLYYKYVSLAVDMYRLYRNPKLTTLVMDIQYKVLDIEKLRFGKVGDYLNRAYNHQKFEKDWQVKYIPEKADLKKLLLLPKGTFGYEFASFIVAKFLDNEFYGYVSTETKLDYLVSRMEQSHDFRHILLGFGITVEEEAGIQGFVLAHFGTTLPGILIGLIFLRIALREPHKLSDLMEKIIAGYQKGKRCKFFLEYHWEEYWEVPMTDVLSMIGIQEA